MRAQHPGLRALAAASIVLGGCGALIGTRDLELDPAAVDGGGDGSIVADATPDSIATADGAGDDAAPDAAPCVADLMNDAKHCGRCGHDCLGGACKAGKCEAVRLGALSDTPFQYVATSTKYVFASTRIALTTQFGGIWRFSKNAGVAPELYVDIRYAEAMAILGDRLYFVVEDDPANDVDAFGGLYSCPLDGTAPCTPTRHAVADNPRALAVDKGKVYYGDSATNAGLMEFTPPSTVVLFRDGYNPPSLYVDGTAAFYTVSVGIATSNVNLIEVLPDSNYEVRSVLLSGQFASAGEFFGTPSFLLGTAFTGLGSSTTGVVRRYPRAGTVSACDFGGSTNKRSYGVWADATRVYWTNEGVGTDHPFTDGSVASCDVAGCCTTPEILWSGTEPRAITGDASALYWVSRTEGALWKIAKP